MNALAATSGLKAHLRTASPLFMRGPNIAVQPSNCFLGRSTKPLDQFVVSVRETEVEKCKAGYLGFLFNRAGRPFVTHVTETKCTSQHRLFENLARSTTKDIDFSPKPNLLVYHRVRDDQYFTALTLEEDGNLSPKCDIYPPFPSENGFCFICSCNGLICFENLDKMEILLWNPKTNEFKILSKSFELRPGVSYSGFGSGMWFDHKSGDYKVMLLDIVKIEDEEGERLHASYEIELYSLKNNSWKKIPCTEFSYIEPFGVCTNGFYYSVASRKGESTQVILSFDFSTAKISTLPLPDINKDGCLLLEYNGLLSVLAYSLLETEQSYELWVMNGSWARESVFHTSGVERPVCFWKNGELLCFESFNNELLVFDRATGKLKHLDIYDSQGAGERRRWTNDRSSRRTSDGRNPSLIQQQRQQQQYPNASRAPHRNGGKGGSDVRNLPSVLQTQRGCFRMTQRKIGSKGCFRMTQRKIASKNPSLILLIICFSLMFMLQY